MLVQITTPPDARTAFCAGLELDDHTGYVVRAAPILRWTLGKHYAELRPVFKRYGYIATRVTDPTE